METHEIKVLNWNIQKQSNLGWQSDLKCLSENVNLALFQELDINTDISSLISPDFTETFSQGFHNSKYKTGVATYAKVKHQQHSSYRNIEPWFRTPKAINISLYPLLDLSQTLLVVNVHAINFTLGLSAYQIQMREIGKLVSSHCGPVILAGDFNTWHQFRLGLIMKLSSALSLDEVVFSTDKRKKVLGLPLDHIFTRGLDTLSSTTYQVNSSDHNPMIATFSLQSKGFK